MFGWLFGKKREVKPPADTPKASGEPRHPPLVEHGPTAVDPIEAPDVIHPPTTPDEPPDRSSGGDSGNTPS